MNFSIIAQCACKCIICKELWHSRNTCHIHVLLPKQPWLMFMTFIFFRFRWRRWNSLKLWKRYGHFWHKFILTLSSVILAYRKFVYDHLKVQENIFCTLYWIFIPFRLEDHVEQSQNRVHWPVFLQSRLSRWKQNVSYCGKLRFGIFATHLKIVLRIATERTR